MNLGILSRAKSDKRTPLLFHIHGGGWRISELRRVVGVTLAAVRVARFERLNGVRTLDA